MCEGPGWYIRDQRRGPSVGRARARGGDLGDGVREGAGPDVARPRTPSKGARVFFEMQPRRGFKPWVT